MTVHTVLHGKIPEGSVATWIIVLAIICGILILFFIAMALHKVRTTRWVDFSPRVMACARARDAMWRGRGSVVGVSTSQSADRRKIELPPATVQRASGPKTPESV